MSIQTDITQKDFKAFVRHVTMGTGGAHSMYTILIGSALVMGVILGVVLVFAGVQLHMASLMVGLFGGVFWLVIFSRLLRQNMGPAPDGCILGPRTVSLAEDGIRETAQKHESLFRWLSVRSAASVGEHVFVMFDRNVGIIVPRRAFASDEERDLFLAEIHRRSAIVAHETAA
jgi:hypothetical protein